MPTLDEIEAEVDELNGQTGTPLKFRKALNKLEEASKSNVDTARMRTIMSSFRPRIPNLVAFNRLRADARDLDEILMVADVDARIARIRDRNDLLAELTGNLQTEVNKANQDANLLKRIKEGVDKATKTATELRALVEDLEATDASAKERMLALIERIGNISTIFEPDAG